MFPELCQTQAFQIMSRAYIALNSTCPLCLVITVLLALTHNDTTDAGRQEAIECLKHCVELDNPADWQILAELTAEHDTVEAARESLSHTRGGAGFDLTRRSHMATTHRRPLSGTGKV